MSTLTPAERRSVHALCSVALRYPDETVAAALPALLEAAQRLPAVVGRPATEALRALDAMPAGERAAHFVATFDLKRRCSPYLTYFAHGDTRRRGVALLRFKEVYRAAGAAIVDDELPDHLAVVCEFGATVDVDAAEQLLLDHRAGLELLRLALGDEASPYAGVVAALCATLPPLRGDDRDAVARLAAEGPPAEEVGTGPDGYGGPLSPPSPRGDGVFVPMSDLARTAPGRGER